MLPCKDGFLLEDSITFLRCFLFQNVLLVCLFSLVSCVDLGIGVKRDKPISPQFFECHISGPSITNLS